MWGVHIVEIEGWGSLIFSTRGEGLRPTAARVKERPITIIM